jgi:hypothetical protein
MDGLLTGISCRYTHIRNMEYIWSQLCSQFFQRQNSHRNNSSGKNGSDTDNWKNDHSYQFGGKSSMPFAGRTTDGRPLAWLQRSHNNNNTPSSSSSSNSASSTKGGNDIKDIGLQATSTISAQAITLSSPFQLFDTIPVPLSSTSTMISRRSDHASSTTTKITLTGGGRCLVTCASYHFYQMCYTYADNSDAARDYFSQPSINSILNAYRIKQEKEQKEKGRNYISNEEVSDDEGVQNNDLIMLRWCGVIATI